MSEPEAVVHCDVHGAQGPAYVCQHLNVHEPIGFIEGYDPDDPEQELFQAWCSACDRVFMEEGEWNDHSEAVAQPRLVCRACYLRMKALNQ